MQLVASAAMQMQMRSAAARCFHTSNIVRAEAALQMRSDAWQSSHLSPAVAYLLHSEHWDPLSIKGTGRAGRILKGDVLAAIKSGTIKKESGAGKKQAAPSSTPSPSPPSSRPAASSPSASLSRGRSREFMDVPLTNIRKVTARRLTEAKQTIPHGDASVSINMNAILSLRSDWKASGTVSSLPSVNDLMIRAAALALRQVPELNTVYSAKTGEFSRSPTVDISVAVATDTGLITPIIKSADRKRLESINSEMKELAKKAKENKLKPEEFMGGSFTSAEEKYRRNGELATLLCVWSIVLLTCSAVAMPLACCWFSSSISNLGMFGITQFRAIINPPQVCILAVGTSTTGIDQSKVIAQMEKEHAAAAAKEKERKAAAAAASSPSNPLPFSQSAAFALPSSSSSSPSPPSPPPSLPSSTLLNVTLVFDERAVNAADAASFLTAFKTIMENPLMMQ